MRTISNRPATLAIVAGVFCLGVSTPAITGHGNERNFTVEVSTHMAQTRAPAWESRTVDLEIIVPARDRGELHASPFFRHGTVLVGGGGANM
ncbi:hypothetical protein ACFYE2_14930 [Kocuria sp. CPCC 205300]|uniref:hypothetical protein n=1 Tax=Kocuria sabuli TaxID=3071448 RepID=UPI0036D76142